MKILGFVMMFFMSLTSYADCPDMDRVAALRYTYYWRMQHYPDGTAAQTMATLCDPNSVVYKVYQGLISLEDVKISDQSKNEPYSTGVVDGSYSEYFKRIKVIVFDVPTSSGCKEGASAYVSDGEAVTMHICPALSTYSIVYTMAVLVHESRHIDGSGYQHVKCEHGELSKMGLACDNRIEDKGSYAVDTEFLMRYSKQSQISSQDAQQARAIAIDTYRHHFNVIPFGIREGIYLQNENGLWFFDGSKLEKVLSRSNPKELVISRNGLPTIYNKQTGQVQSYVLSQNLFPALGQYAQQFAKATPAERESLLDVYYKNDYSCRLLTDRLSCNDGNMMTLKEIYFRSIQPKGFVALQSQLGIASADGRVYILPDTLSELQKVDESDLKTLPNPSKLTSAVTFKDMGWGIDQDGHLRTFKNWNDEATLVSPLEKETFTKIIGPSVYSKDFEGL